MVKQIQDFGLARLMNSEHLSFVSGAQLLFNTCGAENIGCVAELPLYDAAVLVEVDIVKRQRASSLTADLEQLDKERDGLAIYIIATFDTAKHSPVTEAKEAHKQLLPVITLYRGIPYHTNVQETGEIIGMVKDLRAEHLAAHITALNLTLVVDMLEAKNNEYRLLDKQRLRDIPSMAETDIIRNNAGDLYQQIVTKINATVVLSTNDAAETLVDDLNKYINQVRTSYNQRMAHTKKKDGACEEVPSENCTNENCEEHGSSEAGV